MKKLILAVVAIATLTIYSCEKMIETPKLKKDATEKKRNTESTNRIKENLNQELMQLFETIEKGNNKLNTKRKISLENKNNPFDEEGQLHNKILNYIMEKYSENSNSDICVVVENVKKEFDVTSDFSCEFFKRSYAKSFDAIFNENTQQYNPKLLLNSLSKGDISLIEFVIMDITFKNIFNTPNLNVRIAKIKAVENFAAKFPYLKLDEKKKILTTLAVYKYSNFYWGTQGGEKKCPSCLMDAIGTYIATHCRDCDFIEDGADVGAFSALFSAVAGGI